MGAGGEAELDHLAGRVGGDEVGRGVLGGEATAVHDRQAVAELFGLVHVVGGDDQGDPLELQPVEAVPQEMAGLGVEAGGRFVEDEELRFGDEGPGDGQPALHPARERLDLVVGPFRELGELEQVLGPLPDDLLGQVEVAAVDHQVVEDGELEVEGVLLGDEADPAADAGPVGGRVHTEDAEGPVGDRRHAGDHPHGRRLAGTVRAEEAVGLAPGDLEVDPVHGHEGVELLHQAAGRHQGRGSGAGHRDQLTCRVWRSRTARKDVARESR